MYLRGLTSKTMNPEDICTRPTCNFMGPTVKVLINADAAECAACFGRYAIYILVRYGMV